MKKRKRMALFGSSLSSRYRRILSRAFSIAADELDIDLVIFNAYGKLRNEKTLAADNESGLFDYVDFDQFDGAVFDGEGYLVNG